MSSSVTLHRFPTQLSLRLVGWALVLLVAGQGCVATGPLKFGKLGLFGGDKIPVAGEKNPVVQVLTMWQPGEGPGIDGKTTRGFVGQIYLFTAKSPIAAKARGLVEVYVFDDHGSEEEQTKPLHQFRYEPDSWELLGQPGKLGQVHTLFVAYTRPGKHKAQCSLRVTFTPDKGLPVHSEMSYVTLPGRASQGESSTGGLSTGPRGDDTVDSVDAESPDDERVTTGRGAQGRPPSGGLDKARSMQTAQEELARRLQSIDFSALNAPRGRRPATPLDERERQRIAGEVRQREAQYAQADFERDADTPRSRRPLRREGRGEVELAGYEEEFDGDRPAEARRRRGGNSPRPADWNADRDADWESDEEFDGEERPARLSQVDRGRNRRVRQADYVDSRVLAEPLEDEEWEAAEFGE